MEDTSDLLHEYSGGQSSGMMEHSIVNDLPDYPDDHHGTRKTLEGKILHAKKRIAEEQQRRDTNVEEYLKMAAVAQRSQLPQVKQLFEKKNTKAATRIATLQRKLDRYERELNILKESSRLSAENSHKTSPFKVHDSTGHAASEASESSNTSSHNRASKSRMQNMSQGLKTVISKPREIASYLMKQKFGSADNIPSRIAESEATHHHQHHHGSEKITSTEHVETIGFNTHHHQSSSGPPPPDDGMLGGNSECSVSVKSSSEDPNEAKKNAQKVLLSEATELISHIKEIQDDITNLRDEFENFRVQSINDCAFMCQGLQEERFRSERLEEQINDLTELHQAETANLKQALADTEEKLSYQSEERLRDLAELLDACQVKLSRLEQQQQQLVTIEGIENSTARALAVKLVNIGLTMLQLLLLLVATVVSTVAPFVGSRIRVFVSLVIVLICFLVHRKWPFLYEDVLQTCSDFLNRF